MLTKFKGFKSFSTVLLILICFPYLYSQDITNIRFEQEGKKVNIYYDITGAKSGQKFDINVYCSDNGGRTWGNPLSSVIGAVGKNQTAGYSKKITWDVLADREKLTGDVKFQINAKAITAVKAKAIVAGGFKGSSGIFLDSRDGKTYKWVRIDTKIWIAENLNYYTSTGSWCYDDKSSNCEKYGRLYNLETARKVCPEGWHLPGDSEWTQLTDYLGGQSIAGGKLKEIGTTHWKRPNTGATNKSSFAALPGGYRNSYGVFDYIGDYGYWWSSKEGSTGRAWGRVMGYDGSLVTKGNYGKGSGLSVRCVRD